MYTFLDMIWTSKVTFMFWLLLLVQDKLWCAGFYDTVISDGGLLEFHCFLQFRFVSCWMKVKLLQKKKLYLVGLWPQAVATCLGFNFQLPIAVILLSFILGIFPSPWSSCDKALLLTGSKGNWVVSVIWNPIWQPQLPPSNSPDW